MVSSVSAWFVQSSVIMTSEKKASQCDTRMAEHRRGENSKFRREQEEELLLKAWENMSFALRQQTVYEDLRPPGPVQSFLSKQRQSSRRRRVLQPR
ncbi:protein Hook homolog 2-like [Dunckerocampus dactyliophorus]|uniref:protein Hook homolog 2-like n=1 Tax=Dunckerocampus dactyliophorus TaxID=161453 RepID=UPI002406F57D|nr:protein Hook homolog 2-like [Dunckerocampus dactyliophorus]XP_054635058.1 protein Hook homolog 2-like [Dunckerocampus dactyliophorus]